MKQSTLTVIGSPHRSEAWIGAVACLLTLSGCGGAATTDSAAGAGAAASACRELPRVNSGAASGAFKLTGHVLDAQGRPVVGAQLELSGAASAVHFSNLTGGFVFRVAAGQATSTSARVECTTGTCTTYVH